MKPKTCKACGGRFTTGNTLQKVCSPRCALAVAKKDTEKRKRNEIRQRKQALKTHGQLMKDAQVEFNKFIRLRDADEPCISCGRYHPGQYHAGHYRTVGSHPELRFDESNCHKQCAPCNNHKSGNLVEYRINLTKKLGPDKLEWLEGPHEAKKWSRDDLIELKKHYRAKWRELERRQAA
ncbi:recombination protein NinG [Aestuariibacter halophilus]|uniref:Recombination protein NinG n=1 Tax=Fluctibacter halophilus TaxID=226011 RepID=A0ABS8G7A3_9ALTE|nr:recombination protein NinG [Aestuariibacter halophilus]MCC2615951.1 recombination protein NinG [Aestuariibacter halophilus]